ncbi:MAG: hypothetical protein HY868_07415 [Chloroflexi bacterium]|nr:hypothetical protein [Chloroflexota bacterium]
MKFLALLKWKPMPLGDPKMVIAINEAAKAWIKSNLSNGTLDCAYNVVPNAAGYYGTGTINANSLEEVQNALASYPAFAVTDFEVFPLSDVYQAIDATTNTFKRMMGG